MAHVSAGKDCHHGPMAPHALHYPPGNHHLTVRGIVPNILQAIALALAAFVLFAIAADKSSVADLQVAAIVSICLAVIGQTWPPKR